MLVRFINHKGEAVWVNPLHVRMLKQTKRFTTITIGFGLSEIKVAEPAETVAELISAAMPASVFIPDDDEAIAAAAQQAAFIATTG